MPDAAEANRLMTVEEVAAYLGVHHSTVRRYIEGGDLRAVKFGRRVRIERAALAAFTQGATA